MVDPVYTEILIVSRTGVEVIDPHRPFAEIVIETVQRRENKYQR
jgi:hypothetical protein